MGVVRCIVAVASSCAPAGQAPAEEAVAPEAAGGEEMIELTMWTHQNPSFVAANEVIVERFEELHPNVTITIESFPYDVFLQTLQTAMPAGTEADIMEMFGSWVCRYSDRLSEMPDYIMTYGEAEELFFKAPLDGYYCDGKLYGLPNEYNIENGAVLVNKALFERPGLPYPPEWDSIEDLLQDAQALAKTDGDMMSVSGYNFVSGDGLAFQLLAGILQRGGEYWKPDGSGLVFTTPEAEATLAGHEILGGRLGGDGSLPLQQLIATGSAIPSSSTSRPSASSARGSCPRDAGNSQKSNSTMCPCPTTPATSTSSPPMPAGARLSRPIASTRRWRGNLSSSPRPSLTTR